MGGRELPQRSTRGKRVRDTVGEDGEDADQEFWNQEFFAEEAADNDYDEDQDENKEEYRGDEVFDSDFDDPEEVDDDEAEADVDDKPKKKTLKAPEPKAPKPKPKPKEDGGAPPKPKRTKEEVAAEKAAWEAKYAVPTLRRSTVARVTEAEEVRALKQRYKPQRAKPTRGAEWRPLSQAELLAEAARTEVENITSLKALLAMEEETKKKAVIVKHKYMGPIVKLRSTRRLLPGQVVPGEEEAQLAAGGGATTPAGAGKDRKVGSRNKDGTEDGADGNKDGGSEDGKGKEGKKEDDLEYEGLVFYEMVNMHYPPMWLRRHRALPPPAPAVCQVTQQKAKYRDPRTGAPFATAAAFCALRGLPPPAPPAVASQQPDAPPAASGMMPTPGTAKGDTLADGGASLELPEPSPFFPMVQPQALSLDMQALLVSFCKSLHASKSAARNTGAAWAG